MLYDKQVEFSALQGVTLTEIKGAKEGSQAVTFVLDGGRELVMQHDQDCCESVALVDVCGDVANLIGSPIMLAEEVTSDQWPQDREKPEFTESFTWTFYKLATNKGAVTLRWLGESNGYYSESVNLYDMNKPDSD
mgnify:CR=1 FL=1